MARVNPELTADLVAMRGQLTNAFAMSQKSFMQRTGKYCQVVPIQSKLPNGTKRMPDNWNAKGANGFGILDVFPELKTVIEAQGGTLVSVSCDEYLTPANQPGYQVMMDYFDAGKRMTESIGAGPQARQRTFTEERAR